MVLEKVKNGEEAGEEARLSLCGTAGLCWLEEGMKPLRLKQPLREAGHLTGN